MPHYRFDLDKAVEQNNQSLNYTKPIENFEQVDDFKNSSAKSPIDDIKDFTATFISDVAPEPLDLNLKSVNYCFEDRGSYIQYTAKNGEKIDYGNVKNTPH